MWYNRGMYEVYLTRKVVERGDFERLMMRLIRIHRQLERVEVILRLEGRMMRMYVRTGRELPHVLAGVEGFLLARADDTELDKSVPSVRPLVTVQNDTLLTLAERLAANGEELVEVHLVVRKVLNGQVLKTYAVVRADGRTWLQRMRGAGLRWLCGAGLELFDLDLRQEYLLARPPKYLNPVRARRLYSSERSGAVLSLASFPYFTGEHYLNLKDFDFNKHTAVFGASGAGKTKYLAKFIEQVSKNYGDKYHILMIDPHDAMREEIGGLDEVAVCDFVTRERGMSLFLESGQDIGSGVEMTLSLMRALIGEGWNSRLERLLRACLYLLTEKNELSFQNLRRVLTDVAYKNAVLAEVGEYLPESLQEFFGQDYNELRTQWYDATFARVLAFVDEMQLTPAFYRNNERRLMWELTRNKVTLVSLSQARLGERPVKVLAGLIMNQLFMLGMQRKLTENVILVVDEVAVVENPVLARFLAEARKYGISVVVAGQYFAQVSEGLREAVFANVANYVCFRLNYGDAEVLAKYLDMELADNKQVDYALAGKETFGASEAEKARLLAGLPARNVVARLSRSGVLLAAVSGRSLDYEAVPEMGPARMGEVRVAGAPRETTANGASTMGGAAPRVTIPGAGTVKSSLKDLMREQSTSRRKVNG